MGINVKSKLAEWKRVLQIARKPNKHEITSSIKVCLMGISVVGMVGFVIFLAFAFVGI